MLRISSVVVGVVTVATLVVACGKKDETPPAAYGQTPGQYPQQQPGAYPQQQPGAYPQQQPGMAPQGQLATPGPTALPCQNDSSCMTHKCNTQFGKCAFPCVSDADCITGSTCFVAGGALAACIPKPPGT